MMRRMPLARIGRARRCRDAGLSKRLIRRRSQRSAPELPQRAWLFRGRSATWRYAGQQMMPTFRAREHDKPLGHFSAFHRHYRE